MLGKIQSFPSPKLKLTKSTRITPMEIHAETRTQHLCNLGQRIEDDGQSKSSDRSIGYSRTTTFTASAIIRRSAGGTGSPRTRQSARENATTVSGGLRNCQPNAAEEYHLHISRSTRRSQRVYLSQPWHADIRQNGRKTTRDAMRQLSFKRTPLQDLQPTAIPAWVLSHLRRRPPRDRRLAETKLRNLAHYSGFQGPPRFDRQGKNHDPADYSNRARVFLAKEHAPATTAKDANPTAKSTIALSERKGNSQPEHCARHATDKLLTKTWKKTVTSGWKTD